MIDWRIYYADDTTFSSDDGTWEDAPLDGIVAVTMRHGETGRHVLHGQDYYYSIDGGGPQEIERANDVSQQLRARCKWLKYGYCIPKQEYRSIVHRAMLDEDFPSEREGK